MTERITVEVWAAGGAHPELAEVFAAVAKATAAIAAKIRLAGLSDVYGAAGATNVQGEQQQKLDVYANEVMIETLAQCPGVAGLVSEEDDDPVSFDRGFGDDDARFVLSFDPLDGSSNIDVNVNVGTIFGVRELRNGDDLLAAVLRPGHQQLAAGYVVYGPSTVMVLAIGSESAGAGVTAFTLDDEGEFVLSSESLRMPEQGTYYSANEANVASWPGVYREYLAGLRDGKLGGEAYSSRYIGSLVADFHRTLLKGGVFLYPPTEKAPGGKLRLQYEANPLALIAEAAGGAAVNGPERILELEAKAIHGRTPFVVGSCREVEALQSAVREAGGVVR